MEINIGGPFPKDLFEHLFGDREEKDKTALFLLKNEKEIEALNNEHAELKSQMEIEVEELKKEFTQRAKFLEKKSKANHERIWSGIESIMKQKGYWPNEEKPELEIRDGVMYYLKKKE